MNRIVLAILIAASITACGKQISKEPELQENTEEYFKAHGIVQGQPNELRIGGTLFRFPAGVGLNPHTAQGDIRTIDGSPMTLSSKECLEQGKCEEVATPIVKGQADKVTFYLDQTRGYAPSPSPFGGGIWVEISKYEFHTWDGVNANLNEYLKNIKGRRIIDHPDSGLREYVAPAPYVGTSFEDTRSGLKSGSGHGHFFECQPGSSGLCFIPYWNKEGRYQFQIVATNSFVLEHWPEIHPAVVRFIDSVVAK